ncbi:hypothetical protein GCM10023213_20310 [Prosthecobacter algae]|uniref:Translocation and assembly module TamB C-terminal domain-containing protein n=1 Tax=Prosthecobacter algae TaxID=1144682 RepID=A0ABP9P2B6_9BACT
MLVFLLLLVGLAVFHRPLLLTAIRWVGPKAAQKLDLPLSWAVDGSLWGDLRITDVETGGGPEHWLPKAMVGELAAEYDWRALARGDYENSVKRITLHDVEAEADLRRLPASKPKETPPPNQKSGEMPPIVWPRTVDIKNINATVTLADGRKLILRGLTLQMGEGMPGVFECHEFRQEPGNVHLENLRADVEWETRKLMVKNLTLPKQVVLERLELDVHGLWEADNSALVVLLAKLGAARFEVNAKAAGLLKAPMQVQAKVLGRDLRSEELQTLGLPKEVFFEKGTLDLTVAGDPATPSELKVDVGLALANLRTAGATVDAISVAATVKDGRAEVQGVKVTRGSNQLDVTAQALLPQDLKDLMATPWTAQVKGVLPQVTAFLDQPPPLKGALALNVTAEGKGATPLKANGELTGETLSFETYKLPKLRSLFSLDGKQARFELPPLELGVGNTVALTATMLMQDAMPVQANWTVKVADPAGLMKTTGLPPPEKAVKGRVESVGQANFNVQDLSAKNYNGLVADLSLKLDEAAYGEGQVQQVALQTRVEKGRALVELAKVQLDAKNAVSLTGGMDIQPPFAFTAQGDVAMPELTALNALLKSFGAPAMESGAIAGKLQATGQIKPWLCQGTVKMDATTVRTATMPQAVTAALETTFEGTKANLQKLEATLGPWRLMVKGTVDEKQAQLAELKVWQNKTLLLDGTVSAPFDVMKPEVVNGQPVKVAITAKDLRFHEILAAAGIQDIPAGILNADIQVNGRPESAQGRIFFELKDVSVPKGPKAFRPATLRSETVLENKRVKTLTTVTQPPLQPLTVEGDLPLDVAALAKSPKLLNETPLKFNVKLPETDLSFLREYAPDMIRSIPARAKIDVQVTGTVGKPVVKGEVDVDVKEVVWAKPDLPSVRDVKVRIVANDRKITLEDISAVLAGGRVKLNGTVDVTDGANPALDLNIQAREALAFRDPTTSVRANADITCQGTLQQARVAGVVEAVRGRVFKEIDLLPVLKLPADVPPVPPDTGRSEAKLTLPPMLKDWTFDLKVRTRDPLLVSGNLANGAVSADVLLSGRGDAPQLTGGATIDRLLLKLPFSMVKITKGVITLRPAHPFDPDLDIRGESRIGSSEITLYIYGDSTNPKTRFTSTPPMSEPDIVTLLATGTTLNGSASELASEAATRAAFLFLSEFYRKTFNKKKVVREEPPRLNMTFNPSGADRSSDSVQATYDLSEKWRVTGRFTQTGRMKALLGYVLRFGKAAQAMDARPSTSMGTTTNMSPTPLPASGAPAPVPVAAPTR